MTPTIRGLLAVALLTGPLAVFAAPMYSGTGSAEGTVQDDIYVTVPGGGQGLGASCLNSYFYDMTSIVADAGVPSVTIRSWNVTISSTYLTGPNPEYCQSGAAQVVEFPFRNVNASDAGISGSNSIGTIIFDWSYSEDRQTLSGPISLRSGNVAGTAVLTLVPSVPEPGTLALLGLGLAGLGLARRRKTN